MPRYARSHFINCVSLDNESIRLISRFSVPLFSSFSDRYTDIKRLTNNRSAFVLYIVMHLYTDPAQFNQVFFIVLCS